MADRVGQQFGSYRLVRLLGRGADTETYLGEHHKTGAQAAVKLFYTFSLEKAQDIAAFRTQAHIVAALSHPHIAQVMEYGVHEHLPFLVTIYAPQGTLRQRHPAGSRLTPDHIFPYLQQISNALSYAHEQQVVHGKIKPENLLVGASEDTILLTDFSLHLSGVESEHSPDPRLLLTTTAYMSPEQINGAPTPASDQYALAILVYEWLSGARPFVGSLARITNQHLAAPPPSLREKVTEIPSGLEEVVFKALAKDERERFESVQAFVAAFAEFCTPAVSSAEVFSFVMSRQPATRETQAESPVAPQEEDAPVTPARSERTGVFISYSHRDKEHLERLHVHLEPLRRKGLVDYWDDTKIQVGSKWREEIKKALAAAKVAILLLSADFLASEFIAENELPPLLAAAEQEGAIIVQVILSPCDLEEMQELAQFQTVNPPSEPLIDLPRGKQEALWVRVAREVKKALNQENPDKT